MILHFCWYDIFHVYNFVTLVCTWNWQSSWILCCNIFQLLNRSMLIEKNQSWKYTILHQICCYLSSRTKDIPLSWFSPGMGIYVKLGLHKIFNITRTISLTWKPSSRYQMNQNIVQFHLITNEPMLVNGKWPQKASQCWKPGLGERRICHIEPQKV